MDDPEEIMNIGVWIDSESIDLCQSNDAKKISLNSSDPAALIFLTLCLESMGIKFKFTCFAHDQTTSQIINKIRIGELDTLAAFIRYSEKRAENVHFSQLFHDAPYAFLIRVQDLRPSQGALLLLNGLCKEVWIAWIVIAVMLMLFFSFQKVVTKRTRNPKRILNITGDRIWLVFRHMLSQCEADEKIVVFEERRIANGLLFICLSFLTIIMVQLYQTVVYNQIASTTRHPPFRSTEELVHLIGTRTLTLLSNKEDAVYFEMINNSITPHFKGMREALRKNPKREVSSFQEALDLVSQPGGGYVFVAGRNHVRHLAATHCNLDMVEVEMPLIFGGFIFNRNKSRLMHDIDSAMMQMLGAYERLIQKPRKFTFLPHSNQSDSCHVKPGKVRPLSLTTVSGVFLLYVLFILLALLWFLAEKFAWKFIMARFGKHRQIDFRLSERPTGQNMSTFSRRYSQ